MTDQATQTLLRDVFAREQVSLLHYLCQAEVYVGPGDRELLSAMRDAGRAERDALARIADYMHSHDIPKGHARTFPMRFTTYNFNALRQLLPILIADEQAGIANVLRDTEQVTNGEVLALLTAVIEQKRETLRSLSESATV